jgi:predicted CXXCH cytochrome family protein
MRSIAGPFAYQHPPVTESCMNYHNAHGSLNTNLLTLSEPALCLQCHAGHHNGAVCLWSNAARIATARFTAPM